MLGSLGIDDPGWSTDEERYWDLHCLSASRWDREVDLSDVSRSLQLKPKTTVALPLMLEVPEKERYPDRSG